MTTVSSIASHRTERVILKYASGRNAAFTVMIPVDRYGLTWTACEAMVYVDGSSAIITRTGPLSPEMASALSTALQMAIDWIDEEKSK